MIVICGPTGSGKTTTTKALAALGYKIVPTYTSRPPRPDDYGTICIESSKFKMMIANGEFVAFSTYCAVFGDYRWGIRYRDIQKPTKNKVVITTIEYLEGIKRHLFDIGNAKELFLVYLDVSEETIRKIARRNKKDKHTDDQTNDASDRLNRDHVKNLELKKMSDLVIPNTNMELTPDQVAAIIVEEYNKMLRRKGGDWYGK